MRNMIPFPDKKYNIIYADPPWKYNDTLGGRADMGAMPYSVMDIEEIKTLPLQSITEKDCILFMWVTMPKLQEGLETIKAWGFTYKTCAFTWIKTNPKSGTIFAGLGRWVQGNAELCLLATKGHPYRINKSVKQVIHAPRGRHSAKPSEIRDRIVKLMGDIPRIELFAREKVEGWDVWGNEVSMEDNNAERP